MSAVVLGHTQLHVRRVIWAHGSLKERLLLVYSLMTDAAVAQLSLAKPAIVLLIYRLVAPRRIMLVLRVRQVAEALRRRVLGPLAIEGIIGSLLVYLRVGLIVHSRVGICF